MYIVFRAVLNVTTELSRDLARRKRIVVDITLDSVELFSLISKNFEKCATARSGATKDDWEKLAKCDDEGAIFGTHEAFHQDEQHLKIRW